MQYNKVILNKATAQQSVTKSTMLKYITACDLIDYFLSFQGKTTVDSIRKSIFVNKYYTYCKHLQAKQQLQKVFLPNTPANA